MKILDNLGSMATVSAVFVNATNWLFDGSFNIIATLILTGISIPYMVIKLMNEYKIYKKGKLK